MKNFGCKVVIKLGENYKNEEQILRNVTEIHYLYPSLRESVAFESDIHHTGVTYSVDDIKEFSTELETEKDKDF